MNTIAMRAFSIYPRRSFISLRAEVLYGLVRLPEFDDPPNNMKFVDEALADLLPFWQNIAETQLPANETAVREFRHRE